jgi:hypothetical protein
MITIAPAQDSAMALAYVYDGRHKARSCHQALRRTFRAARVDLRRQVCSDAH